MPTPKSEWASIHPIHPNSLEISGEVLDMNNRSSVQRDSTAQNVEAAPYLQLQAIYVFPVDGPLICCSSEDQVMALFIVHILPALVIPAHYMTNISRRLTHPDIIHSLGL